MMPQQLPDICADKGIQQEIRDAVKSRMKRTSLHADTFTAELEESFYHAMMDGLRKGFAYGWKLGQNAIKDRRQTY